ncbi:MAG: hypothetical protein COW30_07745 [Rhodospirillales bacterium CG15_BIG_FIL_POST_REV_8_21_14_020_66_15]|nr:MAG: hypothetical protein COW30_07745 [Rhodospirillales bacterium CG15_BIG_FIL_POST_REV_8_21_14_020_66_15]
MSDTFSAKELTVDPSTFTGDFAWLYAYWAERAGHGGLPAWADIRLIEFPATILPWLVIMDVVDDARRFVFRYWGTERTNLQRVDMTGKSVKELKIPGLAPAMLHQNECAVAARAPILFLNNFVAPSGLTVRYQALRLPLTDGGGDVDKILALSRFIDDAATVRRRAEEGPTPV